MIRFDGKVAIVTGAANGLGRSHAIELAKRGAKVIVNDFGGARDGTGGSLSPAEQVANEIVEAGGEAITDGADVSDFVQCKAMVDKALSRWGSVDVVINNAGILRDKSFAKMSAEDWRAVVDVHLNGSAHVSLAAWPAMKENNYGRIVMTTSTSGIYGNFGQANYGAAKMGLIGLMRTLGIEGSRYNIHVNCLAPTAATRMTEDIMTEEMLEALKPEFVTPAALYLASEEGPVSTVMFAGAGYYSTLEIRESAGMFFPVAERTPEAIAENRARISDMTRSDVFGQGGEHVAKILTAAAKG